MIATSELDRFNAAREAIVCADIPADRRPVCAECPGFLARCTDGKCEAVRPREGE